MRRGPDGPRKLLCMPVRFGSDRAITRGTTVNLSAEGMFVRVLEPEDGGRFSTFTSSVKGHTVPLRRRRMWSLHARGECAPAGMGIRLSDPPPIYQSFVDEIP
jgi:hypothetical protein